jgi:hypothetical protein
VISRGVILEAPPRRTDGCGERVGSVPGGILDPETGVWSALPNPPPEGPSEFGTGVLTESRGHYANPHGWILDTTQNRWIEIPRLEPDRTHVGGRAVTNGGRQLLVFGGAKFSSKTPGGRLLKGAWIWTPPAPRR